MTQIIEIGSLREKVQLLEAPRGGVRPRSGRIKHANGENAEVDFDTLQWLLQRARIAGCAARAETAKLPSTCSYPEDSRGITTCGWLNA